MKSNIETIARLFIQSFINKIRNTTHSKPILESWQILTDPCLYKQRRCGLYGWLDLENVSKLQMQ